MDRSELTGIILAGGKSSRMGREKGLLEIHGKQLISYGIDLLSMYTDRILISSGNPDYQTFRLEMVPDSVTGQGPAAGLAAALKKSTTTWNLIIACDLPFLEPALIDSLLENSDHNQVVIPVHGDVQEPLAGLYHQTCAEDFESAVSSGNLALHKILLTMKVHYLDVSLLVEKYPRMFINLNTPEDLD
jgi:molybdopterin-guanine dinucleotide biosynthesis protein A